MTEVKRRPNGQPAFNMKNEDAKVNNKIYVQGFSQVLTASSTTPIPINLNSAGKKLVGISVIPTSGTNSDIANCQVSLSVNNNNLLLNVGLQNLNPNFIGGGMVYFPTPQALRGNDSITLSVIKNNAANVTVIINIFYVPQI